MIEQLVGGKILNIEFIRDYVEISSLIFKVEFPNKVIKWFKMYHDQDCCEDVYLESVDGLWSDLIGTTVLEAREETKSSPVNKPGTHEDWTFYIINTDKGSFTLRWICESNGYYSTEVSLVQLDKEVISHD